MSESLVIPLAPRIHTFRTKMRRVIATLLTDQSLKFAHQQLEDRLRDWDAALERVELDATAKPEVAVALVGGTGAGKSTLLNALLGVHLLPTSTLKACTAAISELRYSNGDGYVAEIEFLSRDEWDGEVALLRADIEDARTLGGEADGGRQAVDENNKAAWDKIRAVYGPESTNEVPRSSSAPSPKITIQPDLNFLTEPPEIAAALDSGSTYLKASTPVEFAKEVQKYLSSGHRFWPIVKRVKMSGPFDALKCGAAIIDLPGINDPNAAREEVTRNYLKTSRFLWLVFNMKRSLTKDTVLLMQSDEFRQIVMDGKANTLSFIGTHSDDVNFDTACAELGMKDDSTDAEIISERNRRVVREVTSQLEGMVDVLSAHADDPERGKALLETFHKAQIFTVSAADYLSLRSQGRRKPVLVTEDDSEIPLLQMHLEDICAGHDVAAYYNECDERFKQIQLAVVQDLQMRSFGAKQAAKSTKEERERRGKAAEERLRFLEDFATQTTVSLSEDLKGRQTTLATSIARGIKRAGSGLDQAVQRWRGMHWCTVRAIVRRDGRFLGSTGQHDFPLDLARPVLDTITFVWSDFFGNELSQCLTLWTEQLHQETEEFHLTLFDIFDIAGAARESGKDSRSWRSGMLLEEMTRLRRQMDERISRDQRNLYDKLPDQIKIQMLPAFQSAAMESGIGMKQRMVATLADHAHDVAPQMFRSAEEAIIDGVNELSATLQRDFSACSNLDFTHLCCAVRQHSIEFHTRIG